MEKSAEIIKAKKKIKDKLINQELTDIIYNYIIFYWLIYCDSKKDRSEEIDRIYRQEYCQQPKKSKLMDYKQQKTSIIHIFITNCGL